jgi:hypothetical protein
MKNETLKEECSAFLSAMSESITAFLRKISGEEEQQKTLAEFQPGEIVTIADHEMIVLEQMDGATALIRKDCLEDESVFGSENNNYADSIVDCLCVDFANRLAETIGAENILEHDVDLTALTGVKDYGGIRRHASLLPLARYQKYIDVLNQHKTVSWWWLATANATKRHENDKWVLCVSPSGFISNDIFSFDYGVRPFCILKSDIFVSG